MKKEMDTRYFGRLNYTDNNVVTFESGIPGFEQLHDFALIDVEGVENLTCLQSTEDKNICFFMIPPDLVVGDFSVDVDDSVVKELDLKSPDEAELYTILNIPGEFKDATANMKCPVIINRANRHAIQGVLENVDYQIRQRIRNL